MALLCANKRVAVCRCAAQATQNMVAQGRGEDAVRRVLAAIIDTGAVNLQFTNTRYHIAKCVVCLPVGFLCDFVSFFFFRRTQRGGTAMAAVV